jgi:hypothetical protein
MNTNATSGKFWLILTIMLLSGFFNLYAQGNGVWKLERIVTREREQVLGKLTRKVTGEPGDLVFSYDNGNNNSRLIVNGSWSALPEILNPNDEVSVSADLKIEKFIPPSHHYSPIVSLSFASGYSSGSIEEMKMSSGYCSSSLVVKATTSNDPNLDVPTASESVSVKAPESPARLKGDIFIIKVRMGSTDGYREYYYLYKWQ